MTHKLEVNVFKPSGKYYTTEYIDVEDSLISSGSEHEIRSALVGLVDQLHRENYQDMILFIRDDNPNGKHSAFCNNKMLYPQILRELI